MKENPVIKRALISVFDKRGIVAFATFLSSEYGVEILSTGGTAKVLRDANLKVIDVSEYTGFPECFEGRIKTLHPRVHGGLLFRRDKVEHVDKARELKIEPIDMVVVNLYPFSETVKKQNATDEEIIEQIDIGGPGMLRSAAKNNDSVTVVCEPDNYAHVQNQMVQHNGATHPEFRRYLAGVAFRHTSNYDSTIADYFTPRPGSL